jgi:hypothetical protein
MSAVGRFGISFRHAWSPNFEGRMLRLFETGDREEDRIVANLRAVGVTVWEKRSRDWECRLGLRLAASLCHELRWCW